MSPSAENRETSEDVQQSTNDSAQELDKMIAVGRKKVDEKKQNGEDNIDPLRRQLAELIKPEG